MVSNHCVLNTVITDQIIYSPVYSNRWPLIDCHNEVYFKKCFQSFILTSTKVWLFNINSSSFSRSVTKENISVGETVSFRLGCISGTRWHSSCLVTFTFLVHFLNSSFLFFSFFLDWLSLGTTTEDQPLV